MRVVGKERKSILFLFILLVSFGIFVWLKDGTYLLLNNSQNRIILQLKPSNGDSRIHIKNWSDASDSGICTGSGTFADPYVIQDLIIDGNGTGVGIFIEDSKNSYFKIENCTIFNCITGIKFELVNNGTLYHNNCSFNNIGISIDIPSQIPPGSEQYNKNNTILENIANYNNDNGIYLGVFCNNCEIIGNTVNNNNYGILLGGGNSHNNIIKGNIINRNHRGIQLFSNGRNSIISDNRLYNNEDSAIALMGVGYNLTNNLMNSSGLGLGSASVEYLSLLKIDTTNLVNNKHIYYYINKSNLKQEDFTNAGQIFLINCHNSIISNQDVSYSTVGVSLFHSNNISVINTISSNNLYGALLSNTNNSFVIRNNLNKNYFGILIEYCKNNRISENNINYNVEGIWLRFDSYNIITENIISDNLGIGLFLRDLSNNNTIFLNFFRNNGLHVRDSLSTNLWNTTKIGNYWDNYTGIDANGDGIGDTPHIISSSPLVQDYLPIVDNDAPEITIFSPSNNSVFGNTAPSFIISLKEKYINEMWYTLDNGLHNYTFTNNGTISQAVWSALPNGLVKLEFYVMDKTGKIGFAEVIIIKKEQVIHGYNLILLLICVIFFGIVLVPSKVKNKEKEN